MGIALWAALALGVAVVPAPASTTLSPANKKIIADAVKEQLKDPDSAKFRWLPLEKFGLYCGFVNAKNGYGGYSGFDPFAVVGGIGTGPKSKGEFIAAGVTIGSGDDFLQVYNLCKEHGYDLTAETAGD